MNKTEDEKLYGVIFSVLGFIIIIIAIFSAFIGFSLGQKATRIEAVEKGHAEWVVVNKTGETLFKWKEEQK